MSLHYKIMGNSFLDFLRKPVMCKCGHPNKPCHRTGKWYDASTGCKECDCKYFIKRTESEKLNKIIDMIAIVLLGFVAVIVLGFADLIYSGLNAPHINELTVTIHTSTILRYLGLGSILFSAWLFGTVFDFVRLYFRVHRKETKPIDPRWNVDNES